MPPLMSDDDDEDVFYNITGLELCEQGDDVVHGNDGVPPLVYSSRLEVDVNVWSHLFE